MKFPVRCCFFFSLFLLLQFGSGSLGKSLNKDETLSLQMKVENLIEKILHVMHDYYYHIRTELKCIPENIPDTIIGTIKRSIDCVDRNERQYDSGNITSNEHKKFFLKCFTDAKEEVKNTIMAIDTTQDHCPQNMTEKTYQINVTTTFTKTFHINIKNGLEVVQKKIQMGNQEKICLFHHGVDHPNNDTDEDKSTHHPSKEINLQSKKPTSQHGKDDELSTPVTHVGGENAEGNAEDENNYDYDYDDNIDDSDDEFQDEESDSEPEEKLNLSLNQNGADEPKLESIPSDENYETVGMLSDLNIIDSIDNNENEHSKGKEEKQKPHHGKDHNESPLVLGADGETVGMLNDVNLDKYADENTPETPTRLIHDPKEPQGKNTESKEHHGKGHSKEHHTNTHQTTAADEVSNHNYKEGKHNLPAKEHHGKEHKLKDHIPKELEPKENREKHRPKPIVHDVLTSDHDEFDSDENGFEDEIVENEEPGKNNEKPVPPTHHNKVKEPNGKHHGKQHHPKDKILEHNSEKTPMNIDDVDDFSDEDIEELVDQENEADNDKISEERTSHSTQGNKEDDSNQEDEGSSDYDIGTHSKELFGNVLNSSEHNFEPNLESTAVINNDDDDVFIVERPTQGVMPNEGGQSDILLSAVKITPNQQPMTTPSNANTFGWSSDLETNESSYYSGTSEKEFAKTDQPGKMAGETNVHKIHLKPKNKFRQKPKPMQLLSGKEKIKLPKPYTKAPIKESRPNVVSSVSLSENYLLSDF